MNELLLSPKKRVYDLIIIVNRINYKCFKIQNKGPFTS